MNEQGRERLERARSIINDEWVEAYEKATVAVGLLAQLDVALAEVERMRPLCIQWHSWPQEKPPNDKTCLVTLDRDGERWLDFGWWVPATGWQVNAHPGYSVVSWANPPELPGGEQ
jgi:hypothetical protein